MHAMVEKDGKGTVIRDVIKIISLEYWWYEYLKIW